MQNAIIKKRENSKEIEQPQDISVSALNNDFISKIEIEEFVPKETFKILLAKTRLGQEIYQKFVFRTNGERNI